MLTPEIILVEYTHRHYTITQGYIMINRQSHIENPAAYESAIRRNIIANARTTFLRTYADGIELTDYVLGKGIDSLLPNGSYKYMDNFFGSLAAAFNNYGKLTEGQVQAVRKCMVKDTERREEKESIYTSTP